MYGARAAAPTSSHAGSWHLGRMLWRAARRAVGETDEIHAGIEGCMYQDGCMHGGLGCTAATGCRAAPGGTPCAGAARLVGVVQQARLLVQPEERAVGIVASHQARRQVAPPLQHEAALHEVCARAAGRHGRTQRPPRALRRARLRGRAGHPRPPSQGPRGRPQRCHGGQVRDAWGGLDGAPASAKSGAATKMTSTNFMIAR